MFILAVSFNSIHRNQILFLPSPSLPIRTFWILMSLTLIVDFSRFWAGKVINLGFPFSWPFLFFFFNFKDKVKRHVFDWFLNSQWLTIKQENITSPVTSWITQRRRQDQPIKNWNWQNHNLLRDVYDTFERMLNKCYFSCDKAVVGGSMFWVSLYPAENFTFLD